MEGVGCAETYQGVTNPCTEIGCIKYVLTKLLSFEIDDTRKEHWRKLLKAMPGVPLRKIRGLDLLAVGEKYDPGRTNCESRNCIPFIRSVRCGLDNPNCWRMRVSRFMCAQPVSTAPLTIRALKPVAGNRRRCRRPIWDCPAKRPVWQALISTTSLFTGTIILIRSSLSQPSPCPFSGLLGM